MRVRTRRFRVRPVLVLHARGESLFSVAVQPYPVRVTLAVCALRASDPPTVLRKRLPRKSAVDIPKNSFRHPGRTNREKVAARARCWPVALVVTAGAHLGGHKWIYQTTVRAVSANPRPATRMDAPEAV